MYSIHSSKIIYLEKIIVSIALYIDTSEAQGAPKVIPKLVEGDMDYIASI